MRRSVPLGLSLLAVIFSTSATPYTPESYLEMAREQPLLADKVSLLRRCLQEFPSHPLSRNATHHLVTLLAGSNRYEEALQEYRREQSLRKPTSEADLKFLELLLKTGRYGDVLRRTARAPVGRDFTSDQRLFECRIQAQLAQGEYREARQAVDHWLGMHGRTGDGMNRFSWDIQNMQQVRRYLYALENTQGPLGKPLFTASVPDSLIRWSRRKEIPIVFFKLVPADSTGARQEPGALDEVAVREVVNDMNRGFHYLSGGNFSLVFSGLETLYGKADDLGPFGSHTGVLATRVYVHTIPPLYRLAGQSFVVLVDNRGPLDEGTAYMGDGLIRIAASKLNTVTLMHEILHGLGATHQEWGMLARQGYRFDPGDRGLMTFDKGELRDLGLEEKNRILLDWPRVEPLPLPSETTRLSTLPLSPAYALKK